MKLAKFTWLTDHNIDAEVVAGLRALGWNLTTVREFKLQEADDVIVMRRALAEQRVILTHDVDFGMAAVTGGEPVFGIVCLRPGHENTEFTMQTIRLLLAAEMEVMPPFLIVAQRTGSEVRIRLRRLAPA